LLHFAISSILLITLNVSNYKEMNQCVHCDKILFSKQSLSRHYSSCKKNKNVLAEQEVELKIQQVKEQFETKLQTIREQHEQTLHQLSQQHERELQRTQEELQRQLQEKQEELRFFQNQIIEIAKQPKINQQNNSTNNHRTLNIINQLAPYDLTEESVREMVEKHYDEKLVLKGPEGLVKFVVEHLLTEIDSGKKKLVCTDVSRKNGKYLSPDGKSLVKDTKMNHTLDLISPPLCQANVKVIRESEANPQKTNLDKSYCHDRGMCNMIFINDRGRFSTQLAGRLAVENAEEDG
jgi:hypothetical protein